MSKAAVDAKNNGNVEIQDLEPTSEDTIKFLQQQLQDAHLVIGQKEMVIQRQKAVIEYLQAKA